MNIEHEVKHRGAHWQKRAGLGILLVLAAMLASPSFGQQDRTNDSAKKAPTTKKIRRQLPAHFSPLVSQKQRETIYKVQADYAVKMDKLRAQLDAITAERDREIDAVLDPEQLAEVSKKRTAAKEKRAARTRATSSPEEKTDG
jgi:hypothetical protein